MGREAPAGDQPHVQLDLALSCGGLANENARRCPSASTMLMYWPAAKRDALAGGQRQHQAHHLGARRSMRSTRAG